MPSSPEPSSSGMDETRQRMLDAAAQVFAEKGYARATTRELAAAAEVNEVTLFRHFGSKEKLFNAVLEQYGGPSVSEALEIQLSGDYRQDMLMMGKLILNVLLERSEAILMMLCEASHFPEARQLVAQNPRVLRQMLARYLQGQIERGRVRPLDPETMAQAFWGMFFSYAISRTILEEIPQPELAPEDVVSQCVEIFVAGTQRPEKE